MNHSGALEIRVAGIGRDTAFGRILNAVEEAERSRAPIQKTADKLAGYLVWFALACALLTFIITRNLTSTISVIIVAGACVGDCLISSWVFLGNFFDCFGARCFCGRPAPGRFQPRGIWGFDFLAISGENWAETENGGGVATAGVTLSLCT